MARGARARPGSLIVCGLSTSPLNAGCFAAPVFEVERTKAWLLRHGTAEGDLDDASLSFFPLIELSQKGLSLRGGRERSAMISQYAVTLSLYFLPLCNARSTPDAPVLEPDLAMLELGAGVLPSGGLSVSSLTVNAGDGLESRVTLGPGATRFTLSADGGAFAVRSNNRTALTISPDGSVEVHGNLHTRGALRVDGPLNYRGLSQWFLARAEDFSSSCSAWSNCTRSQCGAAPRMLGGYGAFAGGEVSKLYVRLDSPHTELRLKATFHFIDRWAGESAYAKLDNQYVWVEQLGHTCPPKARGAGSRRPAGLKRRATAAQAVQCTPGASPKAPPPKRRVHRLSPPLHLQAESYAVQETRGGINLCGTAARSKRSGTQRPMRPTLCRPLQPLARGCPLCPRGEPRLCACSSKDAAALRCRPKVSHRLCPSRQRHARE